MTSPYYLAVPAPVAPPPPVIPPVKRPQIPKLSLESLDGSMRIPLDGTNGFIRMPGSTGLEMPPREVISQGIPGVAGSRLADLRVAQRPIFIPIYIGADGDMLAFRQMLRTLYRLVDPMDVNKFRLVGESSSGYREMVVSYVSGLEGADDAMASGLSWSKVGLSLVAHSPFAQARTERVLEFRHATSGSPLIGVVGGVDAPWPGALASTAVIGQGMPVQIDSDMPVYPVLELVGPLSQFTGSLAPGRADREWSISIPSGVPAGSTFRADTDPRYRSFRLDGELAAGRVALGSKLRPFYPGGNILNVGAAGASEDTRIRISWRPLYRSLW